MILAALVASIALTQSRGLACGEEATFDLSRDVQFEIVNNEAWILKLNELGVDAEFVLNPKSGVETQAERIEGRPPRLGVWQVGGSGHQRIELARISEGTGRLRATLACGHAESNCYAEIERAFQRADVHALDALTKQANACGAAALHTLITLKSREGQFHSVVEGYSLLIDGWLQHQSPERSAAARLGLADALNALGRATEAEREARIAAEEHHRLGIDYYEARAWETVGIAQSYQGKPELALVSYGKAAEVARAAGEWTALANIQVNQASLQRVWGQYEDAQRLLAQTRREAPATLTPIAAGRMELLEGELSLARGDAAAGLRAARAAEAQFAAAKAPVWVATAHALRGRVLAGLGLHAEAYASFKQALELTPGKNAPVRVARVLIDLAALYEKDEEWALARNMADKAARIYALLSLPVEAGWARRLSADVALRLEEPGAPEAARSLLTDSPSLKGSPAYCLTLARVALVERRYAEVLARTQSEQCQSSGMDGAIERAELRAAAHRGMGNVDAAERELADSAIQWTTLAHASTGQALRHAIARQASQLTIAWLDLFDGVPTPEQLWAWERGSLRIDTGTGAQAQGAPMTFSDMAGRQLLGPEPGIPEVPALGPLADRLGATVPGAAAAQVGSLAQLQAHLPEHVMLLRVYYGNRRSVALWLTKTQAWTSQLPPLQVLRDTLARTQAAVATRQTPYGDTQSRLAELSGQLLTGAPQAKPPRELWVWADGLTETAPFPGLTWVGRDQPLIETTNISYLTGLRTPAESDDGPTASEIELLVASNTGEQSESALAPLYTARSEGELIPRLRPNLKVRAVAERETTRDALVAALQRPGAVVHLASHGQAQPSFLGYAGVWLNSSEKAGGLQFLSWLDIADLRLSSGLAVLNACQLAAGPSATSQGNLSFAAAISNAGVDNVVAAFWPVSDTAATVWVPAFYRALDLQDLDSSAEALRQAQLALRASRHFRHPYYWASLAHFRRLAVPVVVDERAVPTARQLAQESAVAPQTR